MGKQSSNKQGQGYLNRGTILEQGSAGNCLGNGTALAAWRGNRLRFIGQSLSRIIAPAAVCALAALLSAGCAMTLNPPEHRARQYSNEFSSYDEPTQTRLHAATIAVGDDRTAVYIALGKPNERRVGYDRNKATSRTVLLEYWYYAGYPASEVEGHFVTLNNGGFASPLGSRPYGRVVVEFADGQVRSFAHDPEQNVRNRGDGRMAVPPDPHH